MHLWMSGQFELSDTSYNANIAELIIHRAFETLEERPFLHDQLEFELLPTSLDFDFGNWEKFYADLLSFPEIEQLKSAVREVTKISWVVWERIMLWQDLEQNLESCQKVSQKICIGCLVPWYLWSKVRCAFRI